MDAKSQTQKIIRDLNFDFRTFTIERFIRFVGNAKGREIVSIPWHMPATIFGAWLSDSEAPNEYIFYRDNVASIHQVHIQLHELSHYLLGHPTLQINRKMMTKVMDRTAVLPIAELPRLRSPHQGDLETQAELLATLIQERVIKSSNLEQLMHDLSSEERLAAFLKTMGLS